LNRYYPVFLRLTGKLCVVVGGGFGTGGRVRDLLEAGARVRLVAPSLPEEVQLDSIEWEPRGYRPGDLEGASLAIVCAPDRSRNAEIWAEAERLNVVINSLDDTPHCTFIAPAIHRQGDLVVAVSSSGDSPALASLIRDRIARRLGPEFGELAEMLGALRAEVIERFPGFERRRGIWRQLVRSEAIRHLRAGRREAAEAALRGVIERAGAAKLPADGPD
jgi:siroheme synthase-like protein